MEHPDLSQSNLLMDEVNVDLNMLHATMMDRVGGHVDGTDIVAVCQVPQCLAPPDRDYGARSRAPVLTVRFCPSAGGLRLVGGRGEN
jgi:hypothetical protein